MGRVDTARLSDWDTHDRFFRGSTVIVCIYCDMSKNLPKAMRSGKDKHFYMVESEALNVVPLGAASSALSRFARIDSQSLPNSPESRCSL